MFTSKGESSVPGAARWMPEGPAGWFSLLLALFLAVRATTTILAGASWSTPGDGWRSVWQLGLVAVLVYGLAKPPALRPATAFVALVYLGASAVELVTPDALFGVIPVDMRDRSDRVHVDARIRQLDGRRRVRPHADIALVLRRCAPAAVDLRGGPAVPRE